MKFGLLVISGIALVFLTCLLGGCQTRGQRKTGLEKFDLSPQEVMELTKKGEAGDKNAAMKLMLFYGHVRRDSAKWEYWRRIFGG